MRAEIKPSKISGITAAPPSKSMAHRLLICAGLSAGESVIQNTSPSEDILATLDCLRAIGAQVRVCKNNVIVRGVNPRYRDQSVLLNCKESGSTMRFFIPLCLLSDKMARLIGTEKLLSRPLSVYREICEKEGLSFQNNSTGVSVSGALRGGEYRVVGNISSQFISGLLFALPLCDAPSRIHITPPVESRSYIDLTVSALATFGVRAEWTDDHTLYIPGGQRYTPTTAVVEGDYSGAAFFSALNYLGGNVEVTGLHADSLQGDKAYARYFEMLAKGTPTIHIGNCPDLGPILMALAAAKNGAVFCGTRRLQLKESDRGVAMATELAKFGTSVEVLADSIVVYPLAFHAPTEPLCGHNDHRIVMSLATLLTVTGGEIYGAEAVEKSLPDYFEKMVALGAEVVTNET